MLINIFQIAVIMISTLLLSSVSSIAPQVMSLISLLDGLLPIRIAEMFFAGSVAICLIAGLCKTKKAINYPFNSSSFGAGFILIIYSLTIAVIAPTYSYTEQSMTLTDEIDSGVFVFFTLCNLLFFGGVVLYQHVKPAALAFLRKAFYT